MTENPRAILYRMVLPNHACPSGVRAKEMLEDTGYDIDDRILSLRDALGASVEPSQSA